MTTAAPLGLRAAGMLAVVSLLGLLAFIWPLLVTTDAPLEPLQAPLVLALLLPVLILVAVSELSTHSLDVKGLALLGVLAAVGAILRPLGAGTAGMEPIFFLLILGGRVFGPGFGFLQGATTLFASALITAGVGPWLPYQMLAAGFVGLVAGLLPRAAGRIEIALLAGWGWVAAFGYGWLMDLAFWPFSLGSATQLSFDPALGPWINLQRFLAFNLATSMAWNLGRALLSTVLIVVLGPGLLHVLRRAARRAVFSSAGSSAPRRLVTAEPIPRRFPSGAPEPTDADQREDTTHGVHPSRA
ncbi:MAG: ECF transporter S component [Propioniciclava sp.]